jgi:DNA (cytosine-5)-methyltransferase 1
MRRDNFTMRLDLGHELIIDNFAGGGGTSTGLEAAFGRPVDIAINHDPEALAMHAINHPHTRHLLESVWDVNPIAVTGNQPVALVWLSPDCKHFSKAKGGTPVAKHIRGLAWVGMRWVALTKPRVLMLENVEEFTTWGPLLVGADGTARPDPARKGKTFESFVRQLRGHGYNVEYRELRACDHGAPTIRKRLFLVARRDGLPIVWPEATHGDPNSREVLAGKLLPWRSAAECIDFNLPAQSVLGRERPLATNTLRRVAKGVWRYVLSSPRPFIVNTRNGERRGQEPRTRSVNDPYWTVTGLGSQGALAQPVIAPFISEHANASNQRNMPADEPMRTLCAQVKGGHFSLVTPTLRAAALVPVAHGERRPGEFRTADLGRPIGTMHAGGGSFALAAACLEQANGGFYEGDGRAADAPMSTITAAGSNQRLITAYCVKYYSSGGQWQGLAEPMHTLPTKGRIGLVQVEQVPADCLAPELRERARLCAVLLKEHLPEQFPEPADLVLMFHDGQWWVLVDITLRMLKAPELFLAQSFPADYVIHEIPDPALLFASGVQAADPLTVPRIKLSATAQVRMCGNSVAPAQAEALVRANFAHEARLYGRAAA